MGPGCPERLEQVIILMREQMEHKCHFWQGPPQRTGSREHRTPCLPQPCSAWSAGRGHATRLPCGDRRTTKLQLSELHPEPWKDHTLPICVCRHVPVTYSTHSHTVGSASNYSIKTLWKWCHNEILKYLFASL